VSYGKGYRDMTECSTVSLDRKTCEKNILDKNTNILEDHVTLFSAINFNDIGLQ
jgi:hypothetical protein